MKEFSPAEQVTFEGRDRLEGVLELPSSGEAKAGVVLSHPHPLYGGTMAQPVVYRCAESCRERQLATLRFNFRGVGKSRGSYDGEDEARDVMAAAAYLRERLEDRGVEPGGPAAESPLLRHDSLGLMGYSFGSVMSALAATYVAADALALVGFVVASDTFLPDALERLRDYAGPILAICGEHDDWAPPARVDETLRGLGVDYRMTVISGTDHFFDGRQREVGEAVASFFAETL